MPRGGIQIGPPRHKQHCHRETWSSSKRSPKEKIINNFFYYRRAIISKQLPVRGLSGIDFIVIRLLVVCYHFTWLNVTIPEGTIPQAGNCTFITGFGE